MVTFFFFLQKPFIVCSALRESGARRLEHVARDVNNYCLG